MPQELERAMGEEQEFAHKAASPAQVDTQAFQVVHHPPSSARLAPDTHHAAGLWKNH